MRQMRLRCANVSARGTKATLVDTVLQETCNSVESPHSQTQVKGTSVYGAASCELDLKVVERRLSLSSPIVQSYYQGTESSISTARPVVKPTQSCDKEEREYDITLPFTLFCSMRSSAEFSF